MYSSYVVTIFIGADTRAFVDTGDWLPILFSPIIGIKYFAELLLSKFIRGQSSVHGWTGCWDDMFRAVQNGST